MTQLLTRVPVVCDPGAGLLRAEHFQMAYATNDLTRARALLQDELGIGDFSMLEGELPAGGYLRAIFAWVGTVMYEVIEATGPGSEIYAGRLPKGDGFALRHHHLGFLIHTEAQRDAVLAEAAAKGYALAYRNTNPLVEAMFIDVPGLEHYLEYLLPTQVGLDFFASVPRS